MRRDYVCQGRVFRCFGWARELCTDNSSYQNILIAAAIQDMAGEMVTRCVALVDQMIGAIAPGFQELRERLHKILGVSRATDFIDDNRQLLARSSGRWTLLHEIVFLVLKNPQSPSVLMMCHPSTFHRPTGPFD